MDASDETKGGQRIFYPFYLNLAVELVERARQSGQELELGRAPAELQDRFFRYLEPRELRALMILALSEVFDEALFDWLARERLIEYPQHSFHSQLRREHSYLQAVEGREGDWRFHRLMEDALHARWQSTTELKREGVNLIKRVLDYYGAPLLAKPERDWADREVELWRRGMEIIVKQGPELGMLTYDKWKALLHTEPWSVDHYRCIAYQIDFARRTLKALQRTVGPEHPDTLRSATNLGGLLYGEHNYSEAEALCRRVLHSLEKVLGSEHQETLYSINALGLVLIDKGDYAEAEVLCRRAMEGREKVLGPDHPDTLWSIHHLANLRMQKGDYTGAEALFRRALEGREKVLGPDHPGTLRTAVGLGLLLAEKGDYAGAEVMHRRALEGFERAFGPDNPGTLTCISNLGNLLEYKGDYAGSEALHSRGLETRERILGPDHFDTLMSVNNLGCVLTAKGDYAEAESLFRRALEGIEKALGSEHPNTLTAAYDFGKLLERKGEWARAEVLFRRVAQGREEVLGPEHPATLESVNRLSMALKGKGDLNGTISLLREVTGRSPVCLAGLRYTLACNECLSGNLEEAKRLIADEIAAKPKAREQALKDDDLKAIHEFIRDLPPAQTATGIRLDLPGES